MQSNKGYSNLRQGRHSEPGLHYHVVMTTKDRKAVFYDFNLARVVINCLKESDQSEFTETLSFVVMPDHIHWLFVLKKENLSQCIQRMKSQFSRSTGLKIWQAGFYDHGIRNDEALVDVARYIVRNPLRGNLVNHIGQYPHWDAVWL